MNTSLGSINVANESSRRVIGIACAGALLVLAYSVAFAQQDQEQAPPIPAGELDSLVAPIALYPDTLLAQTLAASTYPLEVMQLDQWMKKNTNLKDKALADAVAKQPWDPSVQAMAAFPDVVTRMAENIQWMTDIGNAFLEQQKDVMDAVQRMRVKAQGTGNLKTGSEQKVETKTTASGQQAVVIEQANPDTVYVPSYDPQVVYGAPPAEYPYYPYSYPGYQAGTALAWGTGIAMGAAWSNNNWGNCDWDDANVTINNNNNFNKNSVNNVNKGTGNGWQHNPQHRGNAPYANKQTANKYGGTARGESRAGGTGASGGAGARSGGAGAGPGGANAKAGDRAAGGGAQTRDAGDRSGGGGGKGSGGGAKASGGGAKASGGAAGNRESGGGGGKAAAKGGGGGNNVGNRSVSSGSSGNAFGGGAGSKGSSAKAASSRGGGSMKGGGGGRGGGGKGGGGRKR